MQEDAMYRHTTQSLVTLLLLVVGLAGSTLVSAQDAVIWRPIEERTIVPQGPRAIIPRAYRTFALDQAALNARLATAPLERSASSRATLQLPLPDGSLGRFAVAESPIMEPALAAQFPEIKTYLGQGLDDPTATVRFDQTPAGFHAMILSEAGTIFIDPYSQADTTHYMSYFKSDYPLPAGKTIVEQVIDKTLPQQTAQRSNATSGASLRTYRLAVAATGEYTQFFGGTVNAAMAAIVTTVNRVDGVYEREVAVRLVLVNNNSQLIYTNPATDPYTNNNPGALLSQNQANIDSVIGSANYDIGHVFSTGGGGLAGLGVVCSGSFKAQGETGSSSPTGDAYDIDYVAHEIGHQFGANHTFNGTNGSCGGGNRNSATAYEPGSGSTIMAYAGICTGDDLQSNSDDYFHGISFDEIVAFTNFGGGNTCGTLTSTGNSAPSVEAGASYTIPSRTPFTLTGSASDPNGDALTYHWEEFDLGNASTANNSSNPPFFRSFSPTSSPSRTFPKLSDILNNTMTIGEILPSVSRTMNFRLTARDNRSGGGGVANDSTTVAVVGSAGPFGVSAPNTAVTWTGGSEQTVTWSVANTTQAPISCPNVTILLSTDGGLSFPTTVLASTPNDGTQSVVVPNIATTTARLKVICANNIFFDISNANFTINAVPSATMSVGTVPAEPNTSGNFVVALSQAAPNGGVTVNYSVATGGNAATPGVDYTALSGSVLLASGATTATIPINVLDDQLIDPGETISVTLTTGTGYAPDAPNSASVTIGDNDFPSATISPGAVPAEPNSSGSFVVTLSAAVSDTVTVNYSVATGGSAATPGVDYVTLSGSVLVPTRATTATIPINVLDDQLIDPGETISVTLATGTGYTLNTPSSAGLTIGDDDLLSATISAGTAPAEPNTTGSFTVTLSAAAPAGGVMVNYSVGTAGSAATPGVDYQALSGSVLVPSGATTATIPVVVIDDNIVDPGETVEVTLIAGTNYRVGTANKATLTIGNVYRVFAPVIRKQ